MLLNKFLVSEQGQYFRQPHIQNCNCARCKRKKYDHEYYLKNKEKILRRIQLYRQNHYLDYLQYRRDKHRYERYGISEIDFQRLIKQQKNQCAICHKPFVGTPCIDHSHVTRKIRGLLCKKCNLAVGLFEEKGIEFAKAIWQYLREENQGFHWLIERKKPDGK